MVGRGDPRDERTPAASHSLTAAAASSFLITVRVSSRCEMIEPTRERGEVHGGSD